MNGHADTPPSSPCSDHVNVIKTLPVNVNACPTMSDVTAETPSGAVADELNVSSAPDRIGVVNEVAIPPDGVSMELDNQTSIADDIVDNKHDTSDLAILADIALESNPCIKEIKAETEPGADDVSGAVSNATSSSLTVVETSNYPDVALSAEATTLNSSNVDFAQSSVCTNADEICNLALIDSAQLAVPTEDVAPMLSESIQLLPDKGDGPKLIVKDPITAEGVPERSEEANKLVAANVTVSSPSKPRGRRPGSKKSTTLELPETEDAVKSEAETSPKRINRGRPKKRLVEEEPEEIIPRPSRCSQKSSFAENLLSPEKRRSKNAKPDHDVEHTASQTPDEEPVIVKKRGRKKKEKEEVNISFEEFERQIFEKKHLDDSTEKKKRGRPKRHSETTDDVIEKPFEEKEAKSPSKEHDGVKKRVRSKKKNEDGDESFEKSFEELERQVFEKKVEEPKPAKIVVKTLQEGLDLPCAYVVGDLVWSRVTGHPWWPAMISYDPHKGLFTQIKARGMRYYHVQYFGTYPERGWIGEKSTMKYMGLDGFDEALLREKKEKFKISPKRMPDWEVAVEEADEALKMTIVERKQSWTFIYNFNEPKKARSKTNVDDKPPKIVAKVPHTPKKRHRCSINAVEKALNESPTSEASDPALSSEYDAFVSVEIHKVREENPKLALDELQDLLLERWESLSPKQKRKYEAPDSGDKRKKRVRKPSSKLLAAADMDDDAATQTGENSIKSVYSRKCGQCGEEGHDKRLCPHLNGRESSLEKTSESTPKQRKRKHCESNAAVDVAAPEPKRARLLSQTAPADEAGAKLSNSKKANGDELEDGEKKKKRKSPLTISEEQALEITKLSNSGPVKKEAVCAACEKSGPEEMIQCTGQCQEAFHIACLTGDLQQDGFRCEQCTSGVHSCFVCKDLGRDLQKCSVVMCGKFYHDDCVKTFRQTRIHKSFICPLHCCSTCFVDNPAALKAFKGRLVKCLRCPSAYHTGDFCAAAGSQPVAGFFIVCPKHFRPKKTHAHHAHVNVSWCFNCSKGGMLICCEGCPAAYHADCVQDCAPSDTWYCPDCTRGREPMYGDIVWIKLGNYRWWPAEICHPKNLPQLVRDKAHQVGEFAVRFFGSRDYYWTHRGRIFHFQEGDKGSHESAGASRSFASLFRKAVEEATISYQLWKKTKTEKEQQASDKKPAPFKFIKTNVPVGNVTVAKADLSQVSRCECSSESEHPCGADSVCVNRMLWYECHPALCPAAARCENQRFQLRQHPEQSVFKTAKHGWGLKTLVDIKKGDFVNEYVGELIDDEECRRRIKKAHDDNVTNFYLLTIEKDRIIDAGPKGNYSRFMNHSCNPNCETQKWTINGEVRVGLFAKTDIAAGTELTFNYNLECLGDDKTVCECGAENCSGYLGVRPKPHNGNANKLGDGKAKKKRRRKKAKVKEDGHENECYRCGDGGDLVLCDRTGCPKSYHLACLSLDKMPYGKWECPWHHCDDCGNKAEKLCDECPNSFCPEHCTEENIQEFANGRTICTDHDDIIEAYKLGKETPQDSDASSVASDGAGVSKASAGGDVEPSSSSKTSLQAKTKLPLATDNASATTSCRKLLLPPLGPVKRTTNAMLSARHHEKQRSRSKSGKNDVAEPAIDVGAKGKNDVDSPNSPSKKERKKSDVKKTDKTTRGAQPLAIKFDKFVKAKNAKSEKPKPKMKVEVSDTEENETDENVAGNENDTDASGIPGFKFKTTARRAMQKIKQPNKRPRTSLTKVTTSASTGPKPRKRARLGAGQRKGSDSDDQFPDLVIDA